MYQDLNLKVTELLLYSSPGLAKKHYEESWDKLYLSDFAVHPINIVKLESLLCLLMGLKTLSATTVFLNLPSEAFIFNRTVFSFGSVLTA
jgi:hypothetical protein